MTGVQTCALPISAHGLSPADLLEASNEGRFRPLYQSLLDQARAHLAAGWEYTNALPRNCRRIRLACAWPVLIGAKTLAHLRTRNALDPGQRIKISRAEVRGVMLRSLVFHPWPGAWRKLFERAGEAPNRPAQG